MIIAFDTWILSPAHRCNGYYVYAHRLLREFGNLLQGDTSIRMRPFVLPGRPNDANEFTGSPGLEPATCKALDMHPYLWWLANSQINSRKIHADLLFSPTVRTLPWGLVPTVTMIADTTPLRIPGMIKRRGLVDRVFLNLSSRLSERIITISECSKRDIVDAYGIKPEKVTVTYLSFDGELFNREPSPLQEKEKILRKLGIREPYLLHHGSVHIRKNLSSLIQAYSVLMEKRRDWNLELVLTGAYAWGYEKILEEAGKIKHGRVIVTGSLPDEELAVLLKGASAEVIPSFYEGFCLPMVEAMACGIPTIVSNNSCLPEISGNALRYFDPYSVDDIATHIEAILCDSSLRQNVSAAGLRRAGEFSWEKCARETLKALVDAYQQRTGRAVKLPEPPLGRLAEAKGKIAI